MKNLGFLFMALFASICGVSAQITVEVKMDQEQFLPNESIPVAVRVANHSGQTLHLGKEADWLTFSVEANDGFIILKSGEVPVIKEFDLESSTVATRYCDLAPYFNLGKPGRYSIIATVKIPDWPTQPTSRPKEFDIISGVKLWEQEFGLPPLSATNHGQPEVRKYILQQAAYLKSMRLYLRLTDASESQVFKTFPVGPMTSFSRPEPQLDKVSNLHLIYQTAARTYNYSVINPNGELLLRQTYDYTDTRPRLKVEDEGKITVVGGLRRITSNDLPAPKSVLAIDDVKAPKP
ncbi:MAG: hypothetical protein JWQ71_1771 [Pedosphaera sp.]|nr:hypothetical protein [Pedosphaera sp.]